MFFDTGALILGQPLWMWLAFGSIIIFLLALDLGVLNKKDHVISIRESLFTSAFYISIGILFGGWIYYFYDPNLAEKLCS